MIKNPFSSYFIENTVGKALDVGYTITPGFISSLLRGEPKGFRSEDVEKFLEQYAQSIGFSENLPAAEAFNTFAQNRIHNLEGFSSIKVNGTYIKELMRPADMEALSNMITRELSFSSNTKNAEENFQKVVNRIQNTALDKDPIYKPASILNELMKSRKAIFEALDQQNKQDLELLGKEEFKAKLDTALGDNKNHRAEIISQMTDHLREHQNKEKMAFEKTINERIIALHDNMQREVARINFLATQKDFIKQLRQDNEINMADASLSIGDADKALLKGKTVEDVPMLVTLTGRPMQKEGDGYAIQLPSKISLINPFYFSGTRLRKDIRSLAMAISTKSETIEMRVTVKDQELAKKLGKIAYEECRNAGFPPEKIRIIVNGKVMLNPDPAAKDKDTPDLFAGNQNRKASIEQKAEKKHREMNKLQEEQLGKFDYKDELNRMRSDSKEKEADQTANRSQGRATPAARA